MEKVTIGQGDNTPFRKHLERIAIIFISLLGFFLYFEQKKLVKEKDTLIEASTAELITWKNKEGENLAKIQVLETQNIKTFLAFKSQDSTIRELQDLVKENRKLFKDHEGTAGIIKSETNIDATGATVEETDTVSGYPVYKSVIKDKWYIINSVASKDSTKISLKSFHNLSIVIGEEKQGLFKKPKIVAIAKDSNPYSNIKDMRVFNVKQDKKHFIVGPYIGIGVGSNLTISPQVGLGLTYKIIEF